DPGVPAHPLDLAIDAIPSDAWLIAHDGPPRSGQPVEESGFTNVRPSADRDQRQLPSLRALSLSDHLRGERLDIAQVVTAKPLPPRHIGRGRRLPPNDAICRTSR